MRHIKKEAKVKCERKNTGEDLGEEQNSSWWFRDTWILVEGGMIGYSIRSKTPENKYMKISALPGPDVSSCSGPE